MLGDPTRIHVVGVGGAGMGPLAQLLAAMGHEVSGSDLHPPQGSLGIETWQGGRPGRMESCELVVASSAVPEHDPELEAAKRAGVTVWRRPDLLEVLTNSIPTIGATGTHGKTTTTALAITALRTLGLDPSFIVGGEMLDLSADAHFGSDRLLVLEADEAFGTFTRLTLQGLIVTNVDSDHVEHYGSQEELENAFRSVVDRVDGPVVVGIDDPGGRRLAGRTGRPGYGTSPEARWRITDIEAGPSDISFRLGGDFPPAQVTVGRPGLHNARNACGVLALLAELGYDPAGAIEGLAGFGGVKRRLELRATVAGVTIMDSYAHHPAEIAADLEAVQPVDRNRLWVIFQPHLYSRTARLAAEFGNALAGADRVVVTDIYGSRETPVPGVTGAIVAEAVGGRVPVDYVACLADVAPFVAERVEPGDLVLTLGAGDIEVLPDRLANSLGRSA